MTDYPEHQQLVAAAAAKIRDRIHHGAQEAADRITKGHLVYVPEGHSVFVFKPHGTVEADVEPASGASAD